MLDALIAAWAAANAENLPEVLHHCRKLGIHSGHGEYNKPELVVLSEKMGFNWRQIDNGIWRNTYHSTPLTEEEKQQEIYLVKTAQENRHLRSV